MNSKIQWLAMIVITIIAIGGYYNPEVPVQNVGASGTRFPNGISADSTSPIAGEIRGTSQKLTSTATTTLSVLSTSSTQGVCIPLTATSTATILNMTFSASSTAISTAGVIPVIRYGACQ